MTPKLLAGALLCAMSVAGCASGGAGENVKDAPFATTGPVAKEKPPTFAFRDAIYVEELQNMPEPVKRNLTIIMRAEEFTRSLKRSLANDGMLAADPAQAEYRLTPYFVDLRTSPVSDRATAARAEFHYKVVSVADGKDLFNRRVKSDYMATADPDFKSSGIMGRMMRAVGLGGGKGEESAAATDSGRSERSGPGPARESRREIHAARMAVALNLRQTMRQLVVASPERIVYRPRDTGK